MSESDGQQRVIATGFERSRLQILTHADGSQTEWTERLLLIHSPAYAQQQLRGLEQRLQNAMAKLLALTPPPRRGQRQMRELETLQHKAMAILKSHRVEGLLTYSYEYHPPTAKVKGRYQITAVTPHTTAIEQLKLTFGWRVYATNAPTERLSFTDAVFT